MRIRQPWLIKATAFTATWMVRLWMGTLRYRHVWHCPGANPWQRGQSRRYIYSFWHEYILFGAHCYARRDICVLVSQHADGQLIAETCRYLGFRLARGSTTRGGVEALRQMLRVGRKGHLAITPDGPQGPRRRIQPGLVYLAARTGMPVVPAGIAYERPWRMRSWDRFALPRPWSLAVLVCGEPISVPADADKAQLEEYRLRIENAMQHVTALAEQCVATGKKPVFCPGSDWETAQPARSAAC